MALLAFDFEELLFLKAMVQQPNFIQAALLVRSSLKKIANYRLDLSERI